MPRRKKDEEGSVQAPGIRGQIETFLSTEQTYTTDLGREAHHRASEYYRGDVQRMARRIYDESFEREKESRAGVLKSLKQRVLGGETTGSLGRDVSFVVFGNFDEVVEGKVLAIKSRVNVACEQEKLPLGIAIHTKGKAVTSVSLFEIGDPELHVTQGGLAIPSKGKAYGGVGDSIIMVTESGVVLDSWDLKKMQLDQSLDQVLKGKAEFSAIFIFGRAELRQFLKDHPDYLSVFMRLYSEYVDETEPAKSMLRKAGSTEMMFSMVYDELTEMAIRLGGDESQREESDATKRDALERAKNTRELAALVKKYMLVYRFSAYLDGDQIVQVQDPQMELDLIKAEIERLSKG